MGTNIYCNRPEFLAQRKDEKTKNTKKGRAECVFREIGKGSCGLCEMRLFV